MSFDTAKYSADLAATTLTDLTAGGVPAGGAGTYFFNLCNRAGLATTVRVAITTGGAPVNADYIEYDSPLPGSGLPTGGVLSRWPVPLKVGWRLYVYAAAAGVSVTLIGLKEA